MSAVALLLGLLLVAYVGSQLMSSGTGGYRLASGAEYLLLGLALGPLALGLAERSTLHAFEPVSVVGTAWFALVVGAEYGYRDGARVRFRGFTLGVLLALATMGSIAALIYFLGPRFLSFRGRELTLVAGGVGIVASETTRHVVRVVAGRTSPSGDLSRLVADMADSDNLAPLLASALFFPAVDSPMTTLHLPFWAWAAVTLLVGVVLGGTAAALLRSEPRASDGWGVLIGATLLGVGIAWRLGLAPQATTFALGLSVSFFSRHGKELRAMLARSEQAVLLPTLLLAGADVDLGGGVSLLVLLALSLGTRAVLRLAAGPVITWLAPAPGGAASSVGLGLLTSGALSVTVALSFANRFPEPAGAAILTVAVGLALVGEIFGPPGLRRALKLAGEISEPAALSPGVAERGSGEASP